MSWLLLSYAASSPCFRCNMFEVGDIVEAINPDALGLLVRVTSIGEGMHPDYFRGEVIDPGPTARYSRGYWANQWFAPAFKKISSDPKPEPKRVNVLHARFKYEVRKVQR